MKKITKSLIGLGVISGTILLGSGYQYVEHKYVTSKHHAVEPKSSFMSGKGGIEVSLVSIEDSFKNYEKLDTTSYNSKDVKETSNDLLSGKKGKVVLSNDGKFEYFNKGGDAFFDGRGYTPSDQFIYRIQSHYENNKFSTRVFFKKVLDNKNQNVLVDSLSVNYSVPYTEKTTIIKFPWNAENGSYIAIVFKINKS